MKLNIIRMNINFNEIKPKKQIIAINLSFFGFKLYNHINMNECYFWTDGIYSSFFIKNSKVLPGREILFNLLHHYNSKKFNICFIGNISEKKKNYLNKFDFNYDFFELPFENIQSLSKKIERNFHKLKKFDLLVIILPSPKQEILSQKILNMGYSGNTYCIGGALNMLTKEELACPNILRKYNLEFIWRLKNDTIRRFLRLIQTLFYSLISMNNYPKFTKDLKNNLYIELK